MIFQSHAYQDHALEHVLQNPASGLFMEMGLGKTVVALSAVDDFLNNQLSVRRVLVIGTKKIVQSVWRQEAAKWDHLKHLRFSTVMGTERQRKEALKAKADIFLINRENVPWLVSLSAGKWAYDMVIVDESSSFKNSNSRRFKALRAVLPAISRIIIMTGTPQPQSLLDLWAQVFLLDQGKRLGDSFTKYRDRYFDKDPWSQFVYNPKEENGKAVYEKEIAEKIGDICISLQEKDYLNLPPRIDRIIELEFSKEMQKKYDDFERHEVLSLPDDEEITALNAAGLTNKLLQFANGAVYDEDKKYHTQHDDKLDALEEIIESANGQPVLVFYSYQSDLARIKERFAEAVVLKTDKEVEKWNAQEIKIMVAHPASAGHGLNLQAGGNIIVWFGLPWSLELYQQGNARLRRQGQLKNVIVHHLLMKFTMDGQVFKVLQGKASSQEALMQAVKARISDIRRKFKKVA